MESGSRCSEPSQIDSFSLLETLVEPDQLGWHLRSRCSEEQIPDRALAWHEVGSDDLALEVRDGHERVLVSSEQPRAWRLLGTRLPSSALERMSPDAIGSAMQVVCRWVLFST